MADTIIEVNRAPMLTLWAAVVAERQGYDRDAALALGKAVAGLNAQSKGRSLGIFGPPKAVEGAMKELAGAFEPEKLADCAYGLYERFRPQIASGRRGWGQKGEPDLALIRSLKG